jgi:hypothetical protein
VVLGHSAGIFNINLFERFFYHPTCATLLTIVGGTLALWICTTNRYTSQLPFVPVLCVAIAPIGDLEVGFQSRLLFIQQ